MKKILAGFMTIALSVALVCPVFAGGFVNSITYKPAPELIPTVDEDGKKIIGYVRDEDGNILGESGLIRGGEYIKDIRLSRSIKSGEKIKLKVMGYEPDTYYSAGSVVLSTVAE